ncbi:hypothetical protein AB0I28_29440 [Phytomonospora sp. NPDC050363]|uniref:hypothetical protein n=1 Tax=Phytomonospora sp. NPDC050363 TaxID=3155642 RepID=UPI0033C5E4B4
MPGDLAPPAGFADEALRRRARRRSLRTMTVVTVVCVLAAGATAVANNTEQGAPSAGPSPSSSSTAPPDDVVLRPGGGPRVVHSFHDNWSSYLLDLRTGEYRTVPFGTVVSPDQRHVAVDAEGGVGVAERDAYLDAGEAAVTWIAHSPVQTDDLGGEDWSLDGTKFVTSVLQGPNSSLPPHNSITSHDTTTGVTRATPVPDGVDITDITWAPDSQGFMVAVDRQDGPSVLRSLSFDGVLGEPVELDGEGPIELEGFSPDGARLLYGYLFQREDGEELARTVVMDTVSGETTVALPDSTDADPADVASLAWADETSFVVRTRVSQELGWGPVELFSAVDGGLIRALDWTDRAGFVSVGSSAGLPPEAADLGF